MPEISETELNAIEQRYFNSGYEAGKKDALESISVADAMQRAGWTDNEIGAAMDGRYRGMD